MRIWGVIRAGASGVAGVAVTGQRFGGAHSPGSKSLLSGKRAQKGRMRANFLVVAAVPLLLTAFGGGPVQLASHIAAFGTFALAAWLTREGLEAEDAYNARTVSRRPAIPRKLIGGILTGAGIVAATFEAGLIAAIAYGLIGMGLHVFSFGLDPVKNKSIEGIDEFQTDRVANAIDEAERHLRDMLDAIKTSGDRMMVARVENFQATARTMFRTVENDPRDLTAARRFLGVYLLGAKDATIKFAEIFARSQDKHARNDYAKLLDDLEANFTAKTEQFLLDNKTDLDIEIDVLRDRLQREGIKAE